MRRPVQIKRGLFQDRCSHKERYCSVTSIFMRLQSCSRLLSSRCSEACPNGTSHDITSPSVVELIVQVRHPPAWRESVCAALRTTDYPISTIRILGTDLETGDLQRIEECFRPHGGGNVIEGTFESANLLRAQLASSPAEYFVYVTDRIHIETAGAGCGIVTAFSNCMRMSTFSAAAFWRIWSAVSLLEPKYLVSAVWLTVPTQGEKETDAGYFAQALKPRTCSAPYSELFIRTVRKSLIVDGIDSLPNGGTVEHLALWLAGFASRRLDARLPSHPC